MAKKELLIGFLVGLITTFIGLTIYTLFICLPLDLGADEIISKITSTSIITKRCSIGVLLNIPIVYFFLNKKKENHAKGTLLAIVLIAIIFILNKF